MAYNNQQNCNKIEGNQQRTRNIFTAFPPKLNKILEDPANIVYEF